MRFRRGVRERREEVVAVMLEARLGRLVMLEGVMGAGEGGPVKREVREVRRSGWEVRLRRRRSGIVELAIKGIV